MWDLPRGTKSSVHFTAAGNCRGLDHTAERIVSGHEDQQVKLWDHSGQRVDTFTGHRNIVLTVALSPRGDRILSGSSDGMVKVWKVK
jgi:WD40 repeat protein